MIIFVIMGKEIDILFDLIDIWANENELYSTVGKVVSVDEAQKTCEVQPINEGAVIQDVYLEADQGSEVQGFFVVPEIGSLVAVTFINKDEAFVSCRTSISKVIAKQGEWVFNSGDNGGLTITPELKAQLDKTNNLLQQLINIITGPSVPEPGNGSPSALQLAMKAAITGLSLGDYSNIENLAVKH